MLMVFLSLLQTTLAAPRQIPKADCAHGEPNARNIDDTLANLGEDESGEKKVGEIVVLECALNSIFRFGILGLPHSGVIDENVNRFWVCVYFCGSATNRGEAGKVNDEGSKIGVGCLSEDGLDDIISSGG